MRPFRRRKHTAENRLRRLRGAVPDAVALQAVQSRVEVGVDEMQPDGSKSACASQMGIRGDRCHDRSPQEMWKHIDERLVALHQTNTSATELYRKLYIEIVRAGSVRELRTLLISSALMEEGKTTTALNLAITMAASGGERSVLLVETDFRKPSVQKWLGTCSECGLADYLLGNVEYSQIFANTQIPGLTVVHAGTQVRNPTALISSQKMGGFFKSIKAQAEYNYIILDSSPILLTSEPSVLILHADAAILVVYAGKTSRDMVTQAIETLGPETILGCVLNGIAPTDSYYHYFSDCYQQ